MQVPSSVRWARLLIRVFVAAAGAYLATVAAGAHGALLWLPVAVSAMTTFEAGLSVSPSTPDQPIPVSGPGGPNDPVPVEAVHPAGGSGGQP